MSNVSATNHARQVDETLAAASEPAGERCPSCDARRSPGAAWCTRCFARFEASPTRPARLVEPELSSWDDRYRQAAEQLDQEQGAAKAAALLAELAEQAPGVDQRAGRLAAFAATTSGKIGLAAGGLLALLIVGLGAMTILGHLL